MAHLRAVAAAQGHVGNSGQIVMSHARQARLALQGMRGVSQANRDTVSTQMVISNHGYAVYRITNPNPYNDKLIPPFQQVNVQVRPPVPGQVYNVLYVAVRNGTAQTFDAHSGLTVKFPGSTHKLPILTGDQQWKPGQEFVFYVLTKKYYPVPNVVSSGFEFNLDGIYSSAIPGPSGIFLRVKYNPATFARTLDWIVAFGPGAGGGGCEIRPSRHGDLRVAVREDQSSRLGRVFLERRTFAWPSAKGDRHPAQVAFVGNQGVIKGREPVPFCLRRARSNRSAL